MSHHPFRCEVRYLNSIHWYMTLQTSEFIQLGKEELVPFYAKIVGVILDSKLDNDDTIRKVNPQLFPQFLVYKVICYVHPIQIRGWLDGMVHYHCQN